MRIVIRTDASLFIGSGHVMRCKTLADELCRRGAQVVFICRNYQGSLIYLLRQEGHSVITLPAPKFMETISPHESDDYSAWLGVEQSEDAAQTIKALGSFLHPDWLVVDHYALDESWELRLREHVGKIFVIDDLVNRHHDCDLMLNQNLLNCIDGAYQLLVPDHCQKLLGPRFALLRPEFRKARENLRERNGTVRQLLVFFGGVDPTGETEKALETFNMLGRPDLMVDVVIGSNNPRAENIEDICRGMPNVTFYKQISNMAELMASADLALGAGGTASLERCCVGLPTVTVIIADNQTRLTSSLAARGALIYLGTSPKVCVEDYKTAIANFTPEKMANMQTKCLNLVDGRGLERVILSMSIEPVRLRRGTEKDAEKVWLWRNHPDTLRYFLNPLPVALDKHTAWWNESMMNNKRIILLASRLGLDFGVIRYDVLELQATVSVYLDPDFQGFGLGVLLIRTGEAWLKEQFPAVHYIEATILPENIRSLRSFAAAGFCENTLNKKWYKQIGSN